MNPSFWRGRRVLVTGHTGFKGAWLSQWLARAGAQVTGFALDPPTTPSLFELARVAELLAADLRGDLRDEGAVRGAFERARPEAVFHLAAQSLVRPSYERPVETFAVNVLGTTHVLEAARAHHETVRAVVIVTSDKCYENREWVWGYREDEPMGGHDPYSASKGCAELVTASYRKSFFARGAHGARDVAVGSGRAGNVIGGGDWAADRLVPDAVRAFLAGSAVTLRNPLATRPWQHVLEPLAGYLALGEALLDADRDRAHAHASGFNFGPREEDVWPVHRVVEALARHWGAPVQAPGWAPTGDAHPHEAHSLQLDATKARRALRVSPRWATDEALARVARFHRALAAGEDARTLCARDLSDYEEALTR